MDLFVTLLTRPAASICCNHLNGGYIDCGMRWQLAMGLQ